MPQRTNSPPHPCKPTSAQLASSGKVTFSFTQIGGYGGGFVSRVSGVFSTTRGFSGSFTSQSTGFAIGEGPNRSVGSGTSESLSTFSGYNANLDATLGPLSISDSYGSDGQHVGETDALGTLGLSLGGSYSDTVLTSVVCP